MTSPTLAVVGGGWAGMAAAVEAAGRGADVTVFEATRALGGRARGLDVVRPDGTVLRVDNGQHILIGAYSDTLNLMQRVGVDLGRALRPVPLALRFADGTGLMTPPWAARWPAPLDALAAMLTARGWSWGDRLGMLRVSMRWRAGGFACADPLTVQDLCTDLPARAMAELIEPLCVSALNLPAAQASGQVFLRVMRDALFGRGVAGHAPSTLLLPRCDLGALFPDAAARWLIGRQATVKTGARVSGLRAAGQGWALMTDGGEARFDRVVWATAAGHAAQAMHAATQGAHTQALRDWASVAERLPHTAITTVYAHAPRTRLPLPVLALRGAPAQFVFDRGQLTDDPAHEGVLAFVISASNGERDDLQSAVLAQARNELGLASLQPLQTVVERRATFACLPALHRPPAAIAPGLWAAGDHVAGPYPATLEGAVRSGLAAAALALGPP